MERQHKTLIIAGILILGVVGIIGAIILQGKDLHTPMKKESQSRACKRVLDTISQTMEKGDPFEIPASCLQNGEPVIDELSNATPDDMIEETSRGFKIVQNSSS